MKKQDNFVKDQPAEMPSSEGPLVPYNGKKPPAPSWFEPIVSKLPDHHFVENQGAKIHYQSWGSSKNPGLLLVHGNGAHAHWYDFTAPYLAEDYYVIALDLAGMGDSETRATYSMDLFAADIVAVAEDAGLFDHEVRPYLAAHSFGGFVSMVVAAEHGEKFGGTVIIDSPVNPPDKAGHRGPPRGKRPNKIYPSLEAALKRFRLAPPQECENHYVMDYIARWSLKKVPMEDKSSEEGWTWKFDPNIWQRFSARMDQRQLLQSAKCRLGLIRGEISVLVTDDVREYMREVTNQNVPFISIPEARHHVMIDQPLAFVAALRTLLEDWNHSQPNL